MSLTNKEKIEIISAANSEIVQAERLLSKLENLPVLQVRIDGIGILDQSEYNSSKAFISGLKNELKNKVKKAEVAIDQYLK